MSKKEFFYKSSCRLCDSKDLKTVYKLNPQPIGDNYINSQSQKQRLYPLNLNLCTNCKFVQLSHVIDPDIVYGKYYLISFHYFN